MTARIALVTTLDLSVPDADDTMLLSHLPEAELVCWDDPNVNWADYEAVILRSTWNYQDNLDAFLLWAERVSRVTSLFNPLETIEWNTDKRYLADLAERGFPVVPTTFVDPGLDVPPDVVVPLDGHIVVKPSVGAGSSGAKLFNGDEAAARAHLLTLHQAGKTAMIQPYLAEVDEVGETALMYMGGAFSHAARKSAILSREMSSETGIYADENVSPMRASTAERELGDRIVASLPPLAYTRVDLLPTPDGPVVLELELTEPSLFLGLSDGAAQRAATAFRALLR
jgi:glutathione synthase/RimK-type ligase-like ATP-grasp enzyme